MLVGTHQPDCRIDCGRNLQPVCRTVFEAAGHKGRADRRCGAVFEDLFAGHADHGDYGQDIVCAAVSALAIATVNGLERVVKQPATITADHANGGLLKVSSIDPGHDSQILMQTFLEAMLDIQEQYAENIDIKMS